MATTRSVRKTERPANYNHESICLSVAMSGVDFISRSGQGRLTLSDLNRLERYVKICKRYLEDRSNAKTA